MKRILIVEDAASLRKDIIEMLGFEGYEAIGAENGQEGVEKALALKPELIICDIMMPIMDGFGVLAALKKEPTTATIPFIFLTARTDRLDVRQGMSLGADDYLTKPFTVQDLLNSVKARLEKKQQFKQAADQRLDNLRGNIILALPHELRTPLNVILGFSELMVSDASLLDTERTQEMARHINTAAHRLYHLTENYLTYAQTELITSDAKLLERYRSGYLIFPASAIRHYAHEKARALERDKDLSIDLLDVERIGMSEEYLKKLVTELTDNACKFSAAGAPIRLTSRVDDAFYTLIWRDQGRGMTPDQIANVGAYNQFERRLYEDQGSGLGLIICSRLAELAGGRLTIDSVLGLWTEVAVQIPRCPRGAENE